MVSALDFGSSGPGSRPGWGTALNPWTHTQCLSSPRCIYGYRRIYLWHPIQGREEILPVTSCYAKETGISSGLMGHLARRQTEESTVKGIYLLSHSV